MTVASAGYFFSLLAKLGKVISPTAAAESTENLWYLCTLLINVYVASPDPDPNPRGGGELPNPKSAILR